MCDEVGGLASASGIFVGILHRALRSRDAHPRRCACIILLGIHRITSIICFVPKGSQESSGKTGLLWTLYLPPLWFPGSLFFLTATVTVTVTVVLPPRYLTVSVPVMFTPLSLPSPFLFRTFFDIAN